MSPLVSLFDFRSRCLSEAPENPGWAKLRVTGRNNIPASEWLLFGGLGLMDPEGETFHPGGKIMPFSRVMKKIATLSKGYESIRGAFGKTRIDAPG